MMKRQSVRKTRRIPAYVQLAERRYGLPSREGAKVPAVEQFHDRPPGRILHTGE